jgi:phage gp36-like protein
LTWLTSDEDGAVMPDDTVINDALAAADSRIDAHLRNRYTLPLTDPDPVLGDIAVKLARYWLYTRRPDGPAIPESVRLDVEDANRDLVSIRDGRLSLAGSTSDPTPAVEPGRVRVSAPERSFTTDLLSRF